MSCHSVSYIATSRYGKCVTVNFVNPTVNQCRDEGVLI